MAVSSELGYDINGLAQALGVQKEQIEELLSRPDEQGKHLRVVYIGDDVIIPIEEVQSFLRRNATQFVDTQQ